MEKNNIFLIKKVLLFIIPTLSSVDTCFVAANTRRFISRKPHRKVWTPEQDKILIDAVKACIQNGEVPSWAAIAEKIPGKAGFQCQDRWKKVLDSGIQKGSWTAEEDARLAELVNARSAELVAENEEDNKKINWTPIAENMPGRTHSQCRQRWLGILDPGINKNPWSKEEISKLIQLQKELGNKWAAIAKQMGNGRTELQCRNQWNNTLRHRQKLQQLLLQLQQQQPRLQPRLQPQPAPENRPPPILIFKQLDNFELDNFDSPSPTSPDQLTPESLDSDWGLFSLDQSSSHFDYYSAGN